METQFGDTTFIFSDGACSGNPGPGGWASIIVAPDGHVRERGGGEKSTTNNRMELRGTIEGLKSLRNTPPRVVICTDSTYVIRGITGWIYGWRKNNWVTAKGNPVINQDLWEDLSRLIGKLKTETQLEWRYVKGHSGVPGNERCDEIAVAFSQGNHIVLYEGPVTSYSVAIFDIPEAAPLPEMKPEKAKEKPYSYLSLVGGVAMRHQTWAECERRVKGQSGAKFKKAMSPDDEKTILSNWGIKNFSLK